MILPKFDHATTCAFFPLFDGVLFCGLLLIIHLTFGTYISISISLSELEQITIINHKMIVQALCRSYI